MTWTGRPAWTATSTWWAVGPYPAGPALAAAAAGPVALRPPTQADAVRSASRPTAAYTAERLLLSPAVVKGCQVAIGVTMAFILIIMI